MAHALGSGTYKSSLDIREAANASLLYGDNSVANILQETKMTTSLVIKASGIVAEMDCNVTVRKHLFRDDVWENNPTEISWASGSGEQLEAYKMSSVMQDASQFARALDRMLEKMLRRNLSLYDVAKRFINYFDLVTLLKLENGEVSKFEWVNGDAIPLVIKASAENIAMLDKIQDDGAQRVFMAHEGICLTCALSGTKLVAVGGTMKFIDEHGYALQPETQERGIRVTAWADVNDPGEIGQWTYQCENGHKTEIWALPGGDQTASSGI